MANTSSAKKAVRANESKRVQNKYYTKTVRTAVKKLRSTTDQKEAEENLPKVISIIDKLAKKKIIHKNKAANLKSKLTKKVKSIQN